jgi:hypothetical protein
MDNWELDTLLEINKLTNAKLSWNNLLEHELRLPITVYCPGSNSGTDSWGQMESSDDHSIISTCRCSHWTSPKDIAKLLLSYENLNFMFTSRRIMLNSIQSGIVLITNNEWSSQIKFAACNGITKEHYGNVCPVCHNEYSLIKKHGFHLINKYQCPACRNTFKSPLNKYITSNIIPYFVHINDNGDYDYISISPKSGLKYEEWQEQCNIT